jgi:hypothetical protein
MPIQKLVFDRVSFLKKWYQRQALRERVTKCVATVIVLPAAGLDIAIEKRAICGGKLDRHGTGILDGEGHQDEPKT